MTRPETASGSVIFIQSSTSSVVDPSLCCLGLAPTHVSRIVCIHQDPVGNRCLVQLVLCSLVPEGRKPQCSDAGKLSTPKPIRPAGAAQPEADRHAGHPGGHGEGAAGAAAAAAAGVRRKTAHGGAVGGARRGAHPDARHPAHRARHHPAARRRARPHALHAPGAATLVAALHNCCLARFL